MRLKFYIYSPPFTNQSGGIYLLHRLAHEMTLLGEEVYIASETKNPEWLGIRVSPDGNYSGEDTVAIYPEIVIGNPMGCKQVVRWILNTPGVMGGDGVYQPTDFIYKFIPAYTVNPEYKVHGLMFLDDIDRTLAFKDLGKHIAGKTCYLVRKGSNKPRNAHPDDALNIDDYGPKGGDDYLRQVFNDCETFISYDEHTWISIQAALCGCRSIVVPTPGLSREEWSKNEAFEGYGRSYGFTGEEFDREVLVGKIKEVHDQSIEQIKVMINNCYAGK